MRVIKKSETENFVNGPTCKGYGFPFGDKAIDIAVVTVNGRYPEEGWALNEVCKEVAYILSGSGTLTVANEESRELWLGDAVMIQPGERYYWKGENLEMIMPCSPAFDPSQHKYIKVRE